MRKRKVLSLIAFCYTFYDLFLGLELIMTVYAVSVSVNFLVSLSLLAGVKLEKRWLLVPWITWNTLSLTVSQMAVFYAPNKVGPLTNLW